MKKTLTILAVLLVAASTIFAMVSDPTEGNTVTLYSTVSPETDYLFNLNSKTGTTGYNAAVAGTADFEITSDNIMNFGSAPDAIGISISVTPWVGDNLNEENALSIVSTTVLAQDSRAEVNSSNNGFTVEFTAGYNSTFHVGTFSVGWDDKETLAADDYKSTITIAYTQI